ncbi:MAG TPA: signal peptidase I [Gemmataceae bacterium]|nr:signal peptidase I [Gemmataceae bacterium]
MNTLLLLAVFFLAGLALQTGVLWIAARVCGLERRGWWRAAAVVLIKLIVGLALLAVIATVDLSEDAQWPLLGVQLLLDALVTAWLLRRLLGGTWKRAFATWALQLVGGLVLGMGFVLVIRTCIQAFTASNSSMSPNLRGYHVVEVLPNGRHLIHAANAPIGVGIPTGDPSGAIVAETYEYRETTRPEAYTETADRFICNKTKFPQRWDATVFKYPREPSLIYVKRLVGLPGETITIRDRAVWVNGDRLTPPERLGPIRYESGFHLPGEDPDVIEVTLGPDEYFVLGDNTNRSADSRMWGPVKRELIVGVADLIYWPPARWRIRP